MSLSSFCRYRLRGLSLIEIVIAMTILSFGCLVVFRMFHLGISYSGTIGDEATASIIAQKKLDEIRGWAYERQSGAYNFVKGDWSIWDDKTTTDSDYSKFRVSTYVEEHELKSPSSSVQPYHIMSHSAKIVKVVVAWISGAIPRDFTAVTVIGEPVREISDLGSTAAVILVLGPGDSHTFTAPTAVDENADPIQDISFNWYLKIWTANGTLISSGDTARLTNSLKLPDGSTTSMDGNCSVYCIARYAGKAIRKNVQTVEMHKI